MAEERLLDALIKVKLAEKRLNKLISSSESSEKGLYKKLLKLLLIKDYSTARRLAKSIIEQRRKRRALEALLSKIRNVRNDLEIAMAMKSYSEGIKIAKQVLRGVEKDVENILEAQNLADLDSIIQRAELLTEPTLQQLEEREIDELLKRAELAVLEKLEEEIPSSGEEIIEEEVEVEKERED